MNLNENKYKYWLGKNRPLRHYFQHFCVGLAGIFLSIFIFGDFNLAGVVLFFIGTFAIDLDVIFSGVVYFNQFPYLRRAKNNFLNQNYVECMIELTKNHKSFNKLLLHNAIGFLIVLSVCIYAFFTKNMLLYFGMSGIFFHFILDIMDDIYQLGHVKNWLRPRFLFRYKI